MIPRSTRLFAGGWRRNGRRSRSPDGCSSKRAAPRVVANDLHLDQAGRESGALGIVPAASREASLPAEKRRHQRRCRPHRPAPRSDRGAVAAGRFRGRHRARPGGHRRSGNVGRPQVAVHNRRQGSIQECRPCTCENQTTHEGVGRTATAVHHLRQWHRICACHRLEKHLGMELYFADPGCPYQRGTNENTNGLIRQYFPKGTDFRDVSHSQVRQVENLLNNRPRAASGFELPVRFSSRKPLPAVAIEFGNRLHHESAGD